MQLVAFLKYGRFCGEHQVPRRAPLVARSSCVHLRSRAQSVAAIKTSSASPPCNRKHTMHTSESGSNDSGTRVSSRFDALKPRVLLVAHPPPSALALPRPLLVLLAVVTPQVIACMRPFSSRLLAPLHSTDHSSVAARKQDNRN